MNAADARQAAGLAPRSATLDVRCRHCGSPAGEECHGLTPKTRKQHRQPHPMRVADAAEPRAQIIPLPRRDPPSG